MLVSTILVGDFGVAQAKDDLKHMFFDTETTNQFDDLHFHLMPAGEMHIFYQVYVFVFHTNLELWTMMHHGKNPNSVICYIKYFIC